MITDTSAKKTDLPWETSEEKFVVTKEFITNKNVICAGCGEKLASTEHRPNLDILITHVEIDYKQGKFLPFLIENTLSRAFFKGTNRERITPPKIRRYHLRSSCVRRRHAEFDPEDESLIAFDGSWFKEAGEGEKRLVDLFTKGKIN